MKFLMEPSNGRRPETIAWEQAKFEVPALRWADLGDGKHGFSLINESKYGYDCKGNLLRLSLLRSPVGPIPTRTEVIITSATPSIRTMGTGRPLSLCVTVMSTTTSSTPGKCNRIPAYCQQRIPLSVSSRENLVLTAMKKAEDSAALIFRFYEWAGIATNGMIHVPPGAISATLTNLMELPEGEALQIKGSDQIAVPAKPYSIVSVEVNYPHSSPP